MTRLILSSVLSPFKIPLFTLVAAYCSGILPRRSDTILLALMVKIIEGNPLTDNEPMAVDIPIMELLEKIKNSGIQETDYNFIQSRLITALWSMKSIDDLFEFLTKSKSLLVNTATEGKEILANLVKLAKDSNNDTLPKRLLTRRSFLGQFIFNCIKDFESLEFEELQKFWIGFEEYREECEELYLLNFHNNTKLSEESKNLNDFVKKLSKNLLYLDNDLNDNLKINIDKNKSKERTFKIVSKYDLYKSLNKQVRLLESFGTAIPPTLNEILVLMESQGNNNLPSTYYLKYLQSVNERDYESSFNYLHAYFDYMMSNNSQSYYQYALLSLATLHDKFNSNQQSLEAIKEAILVARENNDNRCLNYLLSWLYNFLKNNPELKHDFFETDEQLLSFLKKQKSNLLNNNEDDNLINCKAYEMETTQLLLNGDSLNKVLESIIKSDYLSISDEINKKESFVINCLLQSTIWSRIGLKELATLYTQVAIKNVESKYNINTIKLRINWINFEQGIYDPDIDMEETNKDLDTESTIINSMLYIKRLIFEKKLLLAKINFDKLQNQIIIKSDLDLKNESILLNSYIEFKLGNYSKSLDVLTKQIKIYDKNSSVFNNYWYIKFNIQYCEVYYHSSSSSTSSNYLNLLPLIYKLLKSSISSNLLTLKNKLLLLLAQILFGIDESVKAFNLLNDSLIEFIQYSNLQDLSLCYMILSQLIYGKHKFQALKWVKLAYEGFKKLNDLENIKNCEELLSSY